MTTETSAAIRAVALQKELDDVRYQLVLNPDNSQAVNRERELVKAIGALIDTDSEVRKVVTDCML